MSDDNGLIKVAVIGNKGRTLVSSRPLKAGEIILKDSPILLYSAVAHGSAAAANYCCHCFRTISPNAPTVVSCPNCFSASLFCSPLCQSIALCTSHTPFVCQSLTRLFAADSPLLHHHHDRHVQARFLVSAYNLAIVSPSHFQTLLSLQGKSLSDDACLNFLHPLISSLWPLPKVGSFDLSLQLTDALLAKDKLNAFGLMEPFDPHGERSVRSYGIYPRASFFNHDCLPNACRFDYVDTVLDSSNADIIVRTIHDLPEGREICLSYFPVNLKYSERQRRLKEDYGFTCDCDRCKVEANWSDEEEEGEGAMDEEEEEDMVEDVNNDVDVEEAELEMEVSGIANENDDFPHAYFFMRYMCNKGNCWGTLAPLPPSDTRNVCGTLECNVCGTLSHNEDLMEGNGQVQ